MKSKICVVIPVYRSEKSIRPLHLRLSSALKEITDNYSIFFVNDGSPDNSRDVLKLLAQEDPKVKVISFTRNFGQHYAITAGMDLAEADWYVVMDCDLQDRPEEIIKFYQKAQEGFDVVLGKRDERNDSKSKVLSSYFFYKVFNVLTGLDADEKVTNFGIYSQKVIRNLRLFRENTRSFPLFIKWMEFKTAKVSIQHDARHEGKSSYTFKKLLNLAFDIIVSHSNKPLRFGVAIGSTISLISFLMGAYCILRYFLVGIPVAGWTSLFIALCFFSGVILFFQGLLGIYIGKIYTETKGRPLYVVDEQIGF